MGHTKNQHVTRVESQGGLDAQPHHHIKQDRHAGHVVVWNAKKTPHHMTKKILFETEKGGSATPCEGGRGETAHRREYTHTHTHIHTHTHTLRRWWRRSKRQNAGVMHLRSQLSTANSIWDSVRGERALGSVLPTQVESVHTTAEIRTGVRCGCELLVPATHMRLWLPHRLHPWDCCLLLDSWMRTPPC